jgi:hypothetical protein
MQSETIWDQSKTADGNVRLLVNGKAVNGSEFMGSLRQPEISQISKISRQQALKRARFQVFEAAMLGEDRLYRSQK